ncbi:hypothetical protein CCHR01_09007 [Colletotrichum chrysophilum]|uniref:Uncharacterized protein n=1 Tax=Colletotrichum chrysophilum TaxID=1836956 RepID=A0AAD9AML9_9PEZI|nr:hypothetical protein CCHR01_09007 [Colletotrichum chrysophilum]
MRLCLRSSSRLGRASSSRRDGRFTPCRFSSLSGADDARAHGELIQRHSEFRLYDTPSPLPGFFIEKGWARD